MNIDISKDKKDKKIIALDIDGTITGTPKENNFTDLNTNIEIVCKEILKLDHKIILSTGRNYLSTLPFYKKLNLNFFMIVYNGALIINPSNKKSSIITNLISNKIVREILNEKNIKENLTNVLIDTFDFNEKNENNKLGFSSNIDLNILTTSEDEYYREIFFNGNSYLKNNLDSLLNILDKKDVLQLVLEIPNKEKLFNNIITNLRKNYNCVEFYYGNKLMAKNKEDKILINDPSRIIIKIRNSYADKYEAIKKVSNYYNINHQNIIAFGNDINDFDMIRNTFSVVPSKSKNLKHYANIITDPNIDIDSNGIANCLKDYFKIKEKLI